MRTSTILSAAALAVGALALPANDGGNSSSSGSSPSNGDGEGESQSDAKYRAKAVKEAFETAWDGYYKCGQAEPTDTFLGADSRLDTPFLTMNYYRLITALATRGKSTGCPRSSLD